MALPRPYEIEAGGLRLLVRLTPRGGRDAVEGAEALADGRVVLKARVRAVPEKGAANAALVALLARAVAVPKSSIALIAGETARVKTLRIAGDPRALAESVERLLGAPAA